MSTDKSIKSKNSISYKKIFKQLNDSCVVFKIKNEKPLIIDANEKFRQTFCDDNSIIGTSLNDLIVPEENMNEAQELDQKTVYGELNEEIVERETIHGENTFLYRGVPLGSKKGFGIYIDISNRIQEKEYIQVLNRILRHNLKNRLTVILGNTRIIMEESDGEKIKENANNIMRSATDINKLIDESDTIRGIIKDSDPDIRSVQLQPIISNSASSVLEQFENAKIEVECQSNLYVNAGVKLDVAIESLIDNGLRHNNSDNPKIKINCQKISNNKVSIDIIDNGVGIPQEDANILESNKTISQLNHSSGLGLWMTKWIINSYHGNIKVNKSRSMNGTKITLILKSYDSESFDYNRGSRVFNGKNN